MIFFFLIENKLLKIDLEVTLFTIKAKSYFFKMKLKLVF